MHSPDPRDLPGTKLLRLARGSIEYGLIHDDALPIDCEVLPDVLTQPGATFTTLLIDGELRGCRGALEAELPLARDVIRSAFQAAFRDPRFDPVSKSELEAIRLEVSVLSPLEPIQVANEANLLDQLTPGMDGLVLIADGRRSTLLPKVWEMFPEPKLFLAALKSKCGLPEDYWSEQLEFLRYRAALFMEPD
jgi:AmmeMemoRadiSam system protein A